MPILNLLFRTEGSDDVDGQAVIRDDHGECVDVVQVGDIVMIMPDKEGVSADQKCGYTLGINVAEVESIDSTGQQISVSFFFGKSWSGSWNRWINKSDGNLLSSLIFLIFFRKTLEMQFRCWASPLRFIRKTWATDLERFG